MILTLDFETFYSQEFTLKKLSTEEYVRDQRFKTHLVGLKFDQKPSVDCLPEMLVSNEGLREQIRQSAVLAWHAHFDGLILAHHYGLRPRLWLDGLSMARLVLPRLKSHSLASVAAYFGLGAKTMAYEDFKGVRDLSPTLYASVAAGCKRDCDLTRESFDLLLPFVPKDEMRVIDATIRMFTEPVLRLDRPRLSAFLADEVARKESLMFAVGATLGVDDRLTDAQYLEAVETELQSSAKFRLALEAIGHPCPMKWSEKASAECHGCGGAGQERVLGRDNDEMVIPCSFCGGSGKNKHEKGGQIPALAKNDAGMKDLLNSEDSRVSALAAARLGVKSTLNETRATRLLETDARGPLPVDLKYCGTHTTRWSGSGALNWQNFPRGGEIRASILAPPGHRLVIGDLSQIEYRLLCWLTGQTDKLDALRAKRDLYCEFASKFYGMEITKADPARRGVGKQGTLQCGYGAGADSIIRTAASGGYGPPVALSYGEGLGIRDLYREEHPHVVAFWRVCDQFLPMLAHGTTGTYKCLTVEDHAIHLPNGTSLDYQGLEWSDQDQEWSMPTRKGRSRLWGSKLTADICQALARALIARALVSLPWKMALTVHDELVAVVPAAEAPAALERMLDVLRAPPPWAPDCPIEAEGLVSERYSK